MKSNHPLDAERYFAQFLREAQSIAPAKKAEAERGRDDARARLGRLEVSAAAGTEVTIDNERAGTAPLPEPIFVEPGAHSVKFKSPGGETDTQSVSVLAGQQVVARYKGGPAATPVPTPIPTPSTSPTPTTPEPVTTPKPDAAAPSDPRDADNSTPPPSSADTGTKQKSLLSPPNNMVPVYIGGGIALAAFGTSVVMLIVKGNAQSNADSVAAAIRSKGGRAGVCSSTNAQDVATFGKACAALNDDNNAVNTDATVGNVALGVGVLALLGTAAYYLAAPKRDSAASATAHVRPVVTPILGPHVGGLSISGSF